MPAGKGKGNLPQNGSQNTGHRQPDRESAADEYTINYRQCGLCALGQQDELSHLASYMCVLDIMFIDWMGGVLHRAKNLAAGGDCCDFCICKRVPGGMYKDG